MAVNSFASNQGTQSALLTDNTGGAGGTLIPVMKVSMDGQGTYTDANLFQGTILKINTIGTLPNLPGGSIIVTAGTIASDTIIGGTLNILQNGTLNLIGTVNTLGTLPNLPGGSIAVTAGTIATLGTMGTLGLLVNGTLANSGTTTGVGTVTNLGSVTNLGVINNAGTLQGGTINLGTIVGKDANAAAQSGNPISMGGTDSGGTVRTILVNASGAMNIGTISVLPNLPQGSINVTAGTIGTVTGIGTITNLGSTSQIGQIYNAGTLQTGTNTIGNIGTLNTGTIGGGSIIVTLGTVVGTVTTNQASGTLNLGTVRTDARTTQNILTYGTQFSGTAAIAGTLIGSTSVGSGTSLWVQDISITNNNANVLCILGFGTTQQGTNVLLRHTLGTSGAVGIEKSFGKLVNAGMTNQDLVFSLGAAGTIDLTFSYLISA